MKNTYSFRIPHRCFLNNQFEHINNRTCTTDNGYFPSKMLIFVHEPDNLENLKEATEPLRVTQINE